MGYLIKTSVTDALKEDMETSLMCYEDEATKQVIRWCYGSMQKALDELPQYRVENADVENAHWVNTDGYDEWECDNCGNVECGYDEDPASLGLNYCPNCGAKMTRLN